MIMGTRRPAPTGEGVECRQARAGKQPGPAAAAVAAPHAALHRVLQLICKRSLLASALHQPATPILDPTQPASASIAVSLRHRGVRKLGLHSGRTGASVGRPLPPRSASSVVGAALPWPQGFTAGGWVYMTNSQHPMNCCSCTGDSRPQPLPHALRWCPALQGRQNGWLWPAAERNRSLTTSPWTASSK